MEETEHIIYEYNLFGEDLVKNCVTISLTENNNLVYTYIKDYSIILIITKYVLIPNLFKLNDYSKLNSVDLEMTQEDVYNYMKENYSELNMIMLKEYFNLDKSKLTNMIDVPGQYQYHYNCPACEFTVSKLLDKSLLKRTMIFDISYKQKTKKYRTHVFNCQNHDFDSIEEIYEYIKEIGYDNIISMEKLTRFNSYILISALKGELV